jgi:hypothetical protein
MTTRRKTIKFKEFMDGSYKTYVPKRKSFKALSIVTVSPTAMLDPTIITFGGIVLLIALAERYSGSIGMYDAAEKIDKLMGLIFPVGALSFFLWFIFTNPFIAWS